MSNFPWWDSTITIFNKVEVNDVVTWYSHIKTGCFWKNTLQITDATDMVANSDSVMLRVPADADYVAKLQFDALANKSGHYTFAPGDIIILGEVSDTIDEYTNGKRSTDLLAKYALSGKMVVLSFTDESSSHRLKPHYLIRGT